MKVVMTLLVRDEADVVDAQLAYHLHAGVDEVIAMDNASTDGTTEILERYERTGRLRLIREPSDEMRQDEWVTRMARLAAAEHGADWVLHADADEFWWPRGGSVKEVLATVPQRYGVVRGCWRHFLPRPDDGAFFAERMADAYEAYRAGRLDDFYAPLVVDDEELAAGLADGTYALDTRLRDTLRTLGLGAAGEPPTRAPATQRSAVEEAALFAAEYTSLGEADLGGFYGARVDELEARLGRLEEGPGGRVRRLAGSLRS